MTIETDYMIINYTKDDEEYINIIENKIREMSKEIVDFFDIKDFGNKVIVRFWNDLDSFREHCSSHIKVEDWLCGLAYKEKGINYIDVLSLKEFVKTTNHENGTLNDIIYLVLHEFVHACTSKVTTNKSLTYWLSEGLATTISHQFDNKTLKFDATLDQINKGGAMYNNYHTMLVYVLENYGKDYILELLHNEQLMYQETTRLYEEVKKQYNSMKR